MVHITIISTTCKYVIQRYAYKSYLKDDTSGSTSAVKEQDQLEARKSSSQVRSPGISDAAKDSPVLNDLNDYIAPDVQTARGKVKTLVNGTEVMHLRHLDTVSTFKNTKKTLMMIWYKKQ